MRNLEEVFKIEGKKLTNFGLFIGNKKWIILHSTGNI